MKILFFTAGPELLASSRTRVYQYMPFLAQRGIKAKVINYVSESRARQNLQLIKLGLTDKIIDKIYGIWQSLKVLALAKFYDVVVIQKVLLPIFKIDLLKLLNANIIFDFDDAIYLADILKTEKHLLREGFFKNRFDHTINVSKHIIVENNYNKAYVDNINPNTTTIIGPIDTNRYVPARSIEGSVGDGKGKIVIGWIGSPDTTKYLRRLDKVFMVLAQKFKGLEIMLIGASLYTIEGVNATFREWGLAKEVGYLQSFDIGIMPLDDDEWTRGKGGYKLLQYMAVGIPCVASPVEVNKDIIEDEVTGFLANSNDEWIDKLSRLLTDRNLREQMGKKGRLRAEKFFSYEANLPKFLNIIERCAGISN